jgi:hypothetical protein
MHMMLHLDLPKPEVFELPANDADNDQRNTGTD